MKNLCAVVTALSLLTTSAFAEIKVGIMLGFTGPIESLTPAMADAAELAFREASDSGFLLNGERIRPLRGDSTCVDQRAATKAAAELISEGVVAIMGADCSGVTGAIASNVAVPNGVVMISPSATSPGLTDLDDKGYFFRTAPSDSRLTEVLAELTNDKRIKRVAISYTNNDYGKGMAINYAKYLKNYGIIVTTSLAHEDGKSNYNSDVAKLSSAGGDALAVIGYLDQGGKGIIKSSLNSGAFDTFVLSDGMIGDSLTRTFGKKINNSFGIVPGSTDVGAEIYNKLSKRNGLDPSSPFVGESYDAAALIILAIQAGGSADKASIAKHVMAVANGPGKKIYPGQLKKALKLLAKGEAIDYEGVSGVELSSVGESYGSFLAKDIKKGKFKTARMIKRKGPEQKIMIVKQELKEEPKKEVVKVVEQDEFKPILDQDDTPPILKIKEMITVNKANYEISGKVIDEGSESGKIYIRVDNSFYPVKKNVFKIPRFSPVDEQVLIVAIDQWGNETSKTINVKVELEEDAVVQKLEVLDPSNINVKKNENKVVLIIGVENYESTPKANYANLDAKYFYEYAKRAFGAKGNNIKLLIDNDASLVKTLAALSKWLPGKINPSKTDLIIFFAGHGLASNDGKELYLLPQDGDPDLLSRTGLSRTEIFQGIIDLKPKSVIMFLDTCYSGISRDEQMLLASARPIRIVASDEREIPNNFTIFSASQPDQISSGLKEAKHGIFSYYLMKGLEGKADANKDKQITNGELLAYMDQNVSRKASELGREQNPSLAGKSDQILLRY